MNATTFFEEVYQLVREIPVGRVVSYGQIARWLGKKRAARAVGWAMRAVPAKASIPWQRVVNSQGKISLQGRRAALQRALLEKEGVEFSDTGQISFQRYGWRPEEAPHQAGKKGTR